MKMLRGIVLCTSILALLVAATSAVYASDQTSGTVYGIAESQPTVSLILGGGGTEVSDSLRYVGMPGDSADEYAHRTVSASNNGEGDVRLWLSAATKPTNGTVTWEYAAVPGANACVWTLGSTPVPATGSSLLCGDLGPGAETSFSSEFVFPTSYTGGQFEMSALITAEDVTAP